MSLLLVHLQPRRLLCFFIGSSFFGAYTASSQALQPITAATFRQGLAPEAYRKPSIVPAAFQKGVKLGACGTWKNNYADATFYTYTQVGAVKHIPTLVLLEKGAYRGTSYVLVETSTCQQAHLWGFPFKQGATLVCFNDAETTDRRDSLCVYQLRATRLHLVRKQALSPSWRYGHSDNRQVRFSKDGTHVYYLSVGNGYFSYKL